MIVDSAQLEERVLALGQQIFAEIQNASPSVFDSQYYIAKLLDWSMRDEAFKVSLFRFVDVFPVLGDSPAVVRHAQEYFEPVADRVPAMLKWGLRVDPHSLSAKMAAPVIAKQIRSMAERFIVGENAEGALKGLRAIRKNRTAFTVDLLGEATLSEPEAEENLKRYLHLIGTLSREVPTWREAAPIVEGHRGEQTPVSISVKLSALYSQTRAVAAEESVAILTDRLRRLLELAKKEEVSVYVDMEDTNLTAITIDTFKQVLMLPELRDFDRAGIVLQAYLRRTAEDLDSLIRWARARGVPIGVRLVKGAYWDSEFVLARQAGWPLPVWSEKRSTDANYERLSVTLLENADIIHPALGSHNLRSLCFAVAAAEALGVPSTDFELQALYGMAEPIKRAFVDRGFLVREYCPIGELVPGMAYLVRRLLENTSNEGFLRQNFREHERPEVLLARPEIGPDDRPDAQVAGDPRNAFANSPLRDFSREEDRESLRKQIAALRNRARSTGEIVKPVIRGEYIDTARNLVSRCPEAPSVILAEVRVVDGKHCNDAVADLASFFPTWRATPSQERAAVLFRAADLLEERRTELTALIVLEAGKPWIDADADVAEGIDFCRYYAHEMIRLGERRRMGDIPGEENWYFYEPRGVAVVIGPWNFPLAIPCGMFAAALVCGNCVVLKPAEQTSLIAARLFEVFLAAGMPARAAAFLPGYGEEIGPTLVNHPAVATIAFTGSKAVGLSIIQAGGVTPSGAEQVKRVIAEMGGKNAIVVDDDADLDEAIRGVVHSAFTYQGQKCSACSRAIVIGKAYERFVSRLAPVVRGLKIGPMSDPVNIVGPVIDEESYKRLLATIDGARKECRVLAEGPEPASGEGYYVRPICFGEIPDGHPLIATEIFGPVLSVERAETFAAAVQRALESEYALTGAVFSRSPKNIEYATREFRVGNLYLNRGSTGALVMRQPFGGARMSGVGSKAGGPDYLLQFLIPRSVCENSLRRGFAP